MWDGRKIRGETNKERTQFSKSNCKSIDYRPWQRTWSSHFQFNVTFSAFAHPLSYRDVIICPLSIIRDQNVCHRSVHNFVKKQARKKPAAPVFLTSALNESARTFWARVTSLLRLFLRSLLPPSVSAFSSLAQSGGTHAHARLGETVMALCNLWVLTNSFFHLAAAVLSKCHRAV